MDKLKRLKSKLKIRNEKMLLLFSGERKYFALTANFINHCCPIPGSSYRKKRKAAIIRISQFTQFNNWKLPTETLAKGDME